VCHQGPAAITTRAARTEPCSVVTVTSSRPSCTPSTRSRRSWLRAAARRRARRCGLDDSPRPARPRHLAGDEERNCAPGREHSCEAGARALPMTPQMNSCAEDLLRQPTRCISECRCRARNRARARTRASKAEAPHLHRTLADDARCRRARRNRGRATRPQRWRAAQAGHLQATRRARCLSAAAPAPMTTASRSFMQAV
jgi:hypothetical protein